MLAHFHWHASVTKAFLEALLNKTGLAQVPRAGEALQTKKDLQMEPPELCTEGVSLKEPSV